MRLHLSLDEVVNIGGLSFDTQTEIALVRVETYEVEEVIGITCKIQVPTFFFCDKGADLDLNLRKIGPQSWRY